MEIMKQSFLILYFISLVFTKNFFKGTILKLIFQDVNCIYLFHDDNFVENDDKSLKILNNYKENENIEKFLMENLIPTVKIKNPNINLKACEDYLIITNNFTKINQFFTTKSENQFKSLSRVVIYTNLNETFTNYQFLLATNLRGIDLIIINNNETLKVIRNHQQIKYPNLINKEEFIKTKWNPNFTIYNQTLTFNVSVADCSPFVYYYSENNKDPEGIDIRIIKAVGKKWNINFINRQHSETVYKTIINDIVDENSNLAACSQWEASISKRGLKMSFPYTQHCGTFLVPKPYVVESAAYVYEPMQKLLWILIIFYCFLISFILTILGWFYSKINKPNKYESFLYSFGQSLRLVCINSLKSFPPQNQTVLRIMITFWCVTCLILSTGYSTGYATILTYPRLSKIVNTLDDMLTENLYWGGYGEDIRYTVGKSLNPIVHKLNKNYINDTNVENRNNWLRKSKNFAIFVKTLPEKYVTDTDTLDDFGLNNLKLLTECTQTNFVVFGFDKNSPFPEIFDREIPKFLEYGFIISWYRYLGYKTGINKNMAKFYTQFGGDKMDPTALDLNHFQGVFYLLLTGYLVALCGYLIEIVYFKYFSNDIIFWATLIFTTQASASFIIKDFLHTNFKNDYCIDLIAQELGVKEELGLWTNENLISSIYEINIPIITNKHLKSPSKCTGYILILTNIEYLIKNLENFDSHKKIFTFFSGEINRIQQDLIIDVFLKGKQLIIITASKIIDIYNNESINILDSKRFNDYNLKLWEPNFSVDKNSAFSVSLFNCTPFAFIKSRQIYDGVEYKIIKEITKNWNVKYRIYDYKFGDLYSKLAEDVTTNQSDLGICSQWRDFSDTEKVDTTYPYSQGCTTFLVPKPIRLPEETFVFQPISKKFWVVTILTTFITILSLTFFAKFQLNVNEKFQDISTSTLTVLATLTLSGPHFPSKKHNQLRIILTSWSLICILISSGYSAGFSSTLTWPRYYRKIDSLEDMINFKITWGANESGTKNLYKESNLSRLMNVADLFVFETSMEERLQKIKGNSHGVMVKLLLEKYITDADFLDEYAKNHLKVLNDCVGIYYYVFIIKKNSPFKIIFDKKILELTERGIIKFWYSQVKILYGGGFLMNFFTINVKNHHHSLKIINIIGAFYLLSIGLIISIVIFILEIIIYNLRK
ncbi:uncharacterized protein [Onthophagus taurus]|uniref:uncharacterized protein n=1 Tax=Onthophagus taurus TaxID=166361 RepID=UPI0039BE7943